MPSLGRLLHTLSCGVLQIGGGLETREETRRNPGGNPGGVPPVSPQTPRARASISDVRGMYIYIYIYTVYIMYMYIDIERYVRDR